MLTITKQSKKDFLKRADIIELSNGIAIFDKVKQRFIADDKGNMIVFKDGIQFTK